MSFSHAYRRFKQFGGWRLLWAYTKHGVLLHFVWYTIKCLLQKRDLKSVYGKIDGKIVPILRKKYCSIIPNETFSSTVTNDEKGIVWFCWLQGIDEAPALVKRCLTSIQTYLPENRIEVLDRYNYHAFVELPTYIEEKYRKGYIPDALFSDILRLELLIKHGGTWIDSSVLMTNPVSLEKKEWIEGIMNADLFMFQYVNKAKQFIGISNWFITAKKGHWALVALRDMLYAYWKDYNCVLDYYIFHRFFNMIVEKHPTLLEEMPKRWSVPSLYLRDRIALDYNESWWNELTSHVCFHKLNYRKAESALKNKRSYYNYVIQA